MSETETSAPEQGAESSSDYGYRMERQAGGFGARLRSLWSRRLIRWAVYLLILLLVAWAAFWAIFARDLPSVEKLLDYEPAVPTMVRGVDGEIVNSFARQRRVQLQYTDFPEPLINAFLSAEDKTFFEHGGLDYPGVAGAVIDYISKLGSDERAKGGSTITQQVAKNLLLDDEYAVTRKIREAILAYRIEESLSKEEILELYLNEIFLGRNAYGVQAAAQAYFQKDVDQLTLSESAYLSILPKAPANYRPETNAERAVARRNWVLGQMNENGWITEAEMRAAQAEPLGTKRRRGTNYARMGGYFMEEVRRQLIDRYGENSDDGENPYSVYGGGLWVRTSLDPKIQEATTKALRDGMMRYDRGRGWTGPINTIEMEENWASVLASTNISINYKDWRIAVVVEKQGRTATIGFTDGETGSLPSGYASMAKRGGGSAFNAMKPGDIITVSPAGANNVYRLRSVPEVSGGMVVESPHGGGRILAMQGGFDSGISSFNRATQAERQPGSTIKPFVYATALDNGMTPATTIVDDTFCAGSKCFRNFGGARGAGSQTMRWGLEQSRNLMTVRAANDSGIRNVVKTISDMGIGEHEPHLATALGSGETTVEKITNAYAMLVNHGRELTPTVIDYVQDRNGKVIFRADNRNCDGCQMEEYDGKPMPRLRPTGKQAMNPLTAFQMVHILQGVVQRGTAQNLRSLGRPVFGKTGTTSGPKDVWFVGGTPDLIAGVYLGFDQPRNMGGYAQGGTVAAPIFKQMAEAVFPDMPVRQFIAPRGIRMVRIERRTGKRVFGGWPSGAPKSAIIWEAFKPETEPRRSVRAEEVAQVTRPAATRTRQRATRAARPRNDNDFLEQQGGIY
ncbi:penicillin-binding protein 1A [Alterisphingorhabdus coralli]|uniref:Penicillin-binding protein 1A n=1 Tax=Alterisphingorhabdus coralli TaxID=3071408 RepID=A0AA97FAN9_9SPHN|nr:PBP1A family penicillin-binding protein [Parasphingorhabdus sp. SCSIO 66989]WOE76268.1 PBP1A family penicillin-binding protein [Parasphingorhabdus sp. SCSIO 66989]